MSWQLQAACTGLDALFFGPDDEATSDRESRERMAKAVCGACAVRVPCADYSLTNPQRHGIWGGLNERERARRHRQFLAGCS